VNPPAGGGGSGATTPTGAGNPLAITGVVVPIGTLVLALAAIIVGAVLLLRRRHSRA
jgi:hypothetical protein